MSTFSTEVENPLTGKRMTFSGNVAEFIRQTYEKYSIQCPGSLGVFSPSREEMTSVLEKTDIVGFLSCCTFLSSRYVAEKGELGFVFVIGLAKNIGVQTKNLVNIEVETLEESCLRLAIILRVSLEDGYFDKKSDPERINNIESFVKDYWISSSVLSKIVSFASANFCALIEKALVSNLVSVDEVSAIYSDIINILSNRDSYVNGVYYRAYTMNSIAFNLPSKFVYAPGENSVLPLGMIFAQLLYEYNARRIVGALEVIEKVKNFAYAIDSRLEGRDSCLDFSSISRELNEEGDETI